MTDPKLPKNPFNSDEDWEEWFKKDRYYEQSLKSSWKGYIAANPLPNNSFMSVKNSYLKIVHSITKNAAVATFAMLIALTTVSASAAELLAPNQYKPSTLASSFLANKQVEKDPYTALKPDENNNVAISESCDLAIKYPKQIENIPIGIQKLNSDQNFTLFTEVSISDQNNARYSTGAQNFFDVTCFEDKTKSPRGELKNLQSLSKEELAQKTGWFITQTDLKNIQYEETLNGTNIIVFEYKNLYYEINFAPETEENKGKNWILFGNLIQLQFNSLVQNEANIEILQKPEPVVNNTLPKASVSLENKIPETKNNLGKVTGTIIYPSDYLPMQRVCAENLQKIEQKCLDTTTQKFSMDLPEGQYYIYVKGFVEKGMFTENTTDNKLQKVYFSKYVSECMMSNYPKDKCGENTPEEYHTTINQVNVKAGQALENINPWDWYYVPQNYNNKKAQTYTNQYYPDLKINYGEDWKMESTTQGSGYEGLLERKIILTKNSGKLIFYIRPIPPDGGGCAQANKIKDVSSNTFRLKSLRDSSDFYVSKQGLNDSYDETRNNYCVGDSGFTVTSTLKSADYPNYTNFYGSESNPGAKATKENNWNGLGEFVKSTVSVNIEGTLSEQELIEADQIVANSKFWTE